MDGNKIIEYFKSGDDSKAIFLLYEYFPTIEKYVVQNNGNASDAQDVFQEALLILYKKLFNPDFEFTAKPESFLFGICKNLWFGELKKRKLNIGNIDDGDDYFKEELKNHREEEEKYAILDSTLSKLGKNCIQILELFYYKSKSMLDIAKLLSYSNVNTVKTQKYKCLERAKTMAQAEFVNLQNRMS